jgi:hypothetical protein
VKKFLLILGVIITFVSIKSYAEEGVQHKNHIAVLVGETYGFYDGGKAHFTAGADYTHRFFATEPNLGLGFFAEAVMGDETEIILGIPLSVFVTNNLKIFVAPSYIIIPAKADTLPTAKINNNKNSKYPDLMTLEETSNESEETSTFFVRAGISYDIHFGKFSLTPSVSADVIYSKLNMLFGLGFGISF